MSLASFDINKRLAALLFEERCLRVFKYSKENLDKVKEEIEQLKKIRKLDIWKALTDLQ